VLQIAHHSSYTSDWPALPNTGGTRCALRFAARTPKTHLLLMEPNSDPYANACADNDS